MTTDIVTAQLTSPGSYRFNEESLLHSRADGFMNDGEEGGADDQTQGMRLSHSSPRINPFHLLSHPESDSHLPPLPPHLEKLASGSDDGVEFVTESYSTGTMPLANGQPPIHVTKVKQDYVEVTNGSSPDTNGARNIFEKVNGVFRKETTGGTVKEVSSLERTSAPNKIMQGPPPSPPLSEGEVEEDSESDHSGSRMSPSSKVTETLPVALGPPIFTPDLSTEPVDTSSRVDTAQHLVVPSGTNPSGRRVSTSSNASRTGSLAVVRATRAAQQRTHSPNTLDSDRSSIDIQPDDESTAHITRTPAPRIIRRSTNPSLPPQLNRSPLLQSQSSLSAVPLRSRTTVPGLEGSALDSDILAHTEIIRRERLERRQKKAGAEQLSPEPKAEPKPKEDPKVLVGNLIGEDHVNYVLMYNMLTGIRIGVSRCQAKIKRPITEEDYVARHKFSFDIIGNELTPSAKYDFKFKDYAPWIFRDLRDEYFHLDPADYLLSLTAKYILSELGSPGKSGSFFYFSRDYRFIIKTISHSEHKFLRSILKDYHEHVKSNPHTLLSRFYGLHRVKLPRGRKIHFVIMNNLFPPHRDIHETYDLKGSAYGREYDEEKAKKNPKAVLKDVNWVNRNRTLELGPEKRALLSEQLRRDQEFLKRIRVMDYSLLVGIHNMERGNRDNLRENQLTVFHPEMPTSRRKPSTVKASSEASNVRKAVRRSDPKMLDAASQLPTADSADRRHFLFYQDEGGLRATDEANQNMDVIYYLGVIDICTPYNTVKRLEHFWKSMTEDRQTISCVDPSTYGQRFLNFLFSVMRGGDPALRPVGLERVTVKEEERPVGNDQSEAISNRRSESD